MDIWTDIFKYDLQGEPKAANSRTDLGLDTDPDPEINAGEIFATDENGGFLCVGDDFVRYIAGLR